MHQYWEQIEEQANEGDDRVFSASSYVLSDHVEELTLTTLGNHDGTGTRATTGSAAMMVTTDLKVWAGKTTLMATPAMTKSTAATAMITCMVAMMAR